jgi:AraC-like DNA-binding protein
MRERGACGRSLCGKIRLSQLFVSAAGDAHTVDWRYPHKQTDSQPELKLHRYLRSLPWLLGKAEATCMALSTQQQEPPGSAPLHRQQEVGKTGGAAGGRPGITGLTTNVQTHPLLAEIVDLIMDWDVPDGDVARVLTPKTLPSTCPYLLAQYRAPIRSDRHFGSGSYRHRQYGHVATTVGTGVVTVRPSGPLGVLIIRLKPEAAARLMGERMQDFVNEKVDLGHLFNPVDLSLLEEMLMEAPDSVARFARIESFLLQNLRRHCRPDPVVCRAAQCLRRNPSLRVKRLAAQLDVSERHLSRSFRAMFGASPKLFARVARIEKLLAMRQRGSAWADIAYACGFADQAHMINDFDAIVGEPPQHFFRTTAADAHLERNAPIDRSVAPVFFECFR